MAKEKPKKKIDDWEKEVECGDSIRALQPLFHREDGGATPTSPLQFKLIEIKAQMASKLNELWHSRLPKIHWSCITRNTHYVCYGAIFNGICYGVGIWSSPVAQNRFKDGKTMLELRRLAIASDAPKYTASWMIGLMIKLIKKKFPDIKRLISYQDTAVHRGIIYKASNWEKTTETEFTSWTTKTRKRSKDQATGKKIRWEKTLKNLKNN